MHKLTPSTTPSHHHPEKKTLPPKKKTKKKPSIKLAFLEVIVSLAPEAILRIWFIDKRQLSQCYPKTSNKTIGINSRVPNIEEITFKRILYRGYVKKYLDKALDGYLSSIVSATSLPRYLHIYFYTPIQTCYANIQTWLGSDLNQTI